MQGFTESRISISLTAHFMTNVASNRLTPVFESGGEPRNSPLCQLVRSPVSGNVCADRVERSLAVLGAHLRPAGFPDLSARRAEKPAPSRTRTISAGGNVLPEPAPVGRRPVSSRARLAARGGQRSDRLRRAAVTCRRPSVQHVGSAAHMAEPPDAQVSAAADVTATDLWEGRLYTSPPRAHAWAAAAAAAVVMELRGW